MKPKPQGNGSGKLEILMTDKGGWLVVYPSRQDSLPHDLSIHLSLALEQWFRERPHLRVRSALPIVKDGDTVLIHAWYDQVAWPVLSPTPPQPDNPTQ